MKHIFSFIICLLIVLSFLCACSQTDNSTIYNGKEYSIYTENGSCYLDIHLKQPITNSENSAISASIKAPSMSFKSIADMKDTLIHGKIPDDVLHAFSMAYGSNDELEICDLNNLYDITLPQDVVLKNIEWYGKYYLFSFSSDQLSGYLVPCSLDTFNYYYDKQYANFWMETQVIESEEIDITKNAKIVISTNDVGRFKNVYYEIEIESGIMYVNECYNLEYWQYLSIYHEPSNDIPNRILFCGTYQNTYFYGGLITDKFGAPSSQWLSQIGIIKYEE